MKVAILHYLESYPPAKNVFEELTSVGEICLIGGVLREFIDHKAIVNLRDIDIVINIIHRERYENVLQKYSVKTNRFDGNKLQCGGLLIDIWPIDQTWAFRHKLVSCDANHYFDRLPETVFLNIDGIVFDWQSEKWNDTFYYNAMNSKTLDVVLPQNPQLYLNILRTFILQERYQMKLSEALQSIILSEYIKSGSTSEFVNSLMVEQLRRYQKEILTKQDIAGKIQSMI